MQKSKNKKLKLIGNELCSKESDFIKNLNRSLSKIIPVENQNIKTLNFEQVKYFKLSLSSINNFASYLVTTKYCNLFWKY